MYGEHRSSKGQEWKNVQRATRHCVGDLATGRHGVEAVTLPGCPGLGFCGGKDSGRQKRPQEYLPMGHGAAELAGIQGI